MTIIRATCPTCGDVELRPHEVHLYDGPVPQYRFVCPPCGQVIRKTANPETTGVLVSGGVHLEHIPAEVWELHVGPRISPDDLLDAHQLLADPDVDILRVLHRDTFNRRPQA